MSAPLRRIKTALVPIGTGVSGQTALTLAKAIAEEVILVGVVCIAEGEAVSAGAQTARQIRKRLMSMSDSSTRFKSTVIVSEKPWKDLQDVVASERPDLFILEREDGQATCGISVADVLSNLLCNVAIVRGAERVKLERTLIAVRGGPHADLALRVGMGLNPAQLDVLHLALTGTVNDAPFKGLKHILRQLPEVNLRSIVTDDIALSIFEEANHYDLVVLGATASKSMGSSSIGPVAEKLLRESPATVMVVKTGRPISESMFDETAGAQAISILVDKWFAENTFHADEFSDLKQLMELKEKQGSTISLALPALNEEETVGKVITTIKKVLMDKVPLLDEIVLIDSDSSDNTRQIAEDLGIPVYIHQQLLPELGARHGKGEALWKSLLVTKGDIIAWIDTDVVNIHPRFVYGIIGPLLLNRTIQFVKGFYRRPLKVGKKMQAGGGGRVTELTARPLLNLFYPELSGVIQPLSGEYAGRRESLEKAVFFSGYGVETGLLIDIFEQHGLGAIAQVDLLERIHHNQELEALSKMSFAIIQTVLRKLETHYERAIIEDVNKSMKLIHYADGGYFLDVEEVAERERPPMITLPAYLECHKK
jgi:glycosyltransferase involved in cell wall biosynthesis